MNRHHLIFVCLLSMTLTLSIALSHMDPKESYSNPHPKFPSMSQQAGSAGHADQVVVGYLLGCQLLVLFSASLLLGVKRGKSSAITWIVVTAGVYLFIYSMLIFTYREGMRAASFYLGLPLPTALLVFGIWLVPFLLVMLFVVNYRRWIFDAKDAAHFAEIKSQWKTSDG